MQELDADLEPLGEDPEIISGDLLEETPNTTTTLNNSLCDLESATDDSPRPVEVFVDDDMWDPFLESTGIPASVTFTERA